MTATPDVRIREADPADPAEAETLHQVAYAAFAARPPLDPPADALGDTVETWQRYLAEHTVLAAELDGRIVGAVVLAAEGDRLWLRRFGVHPEAQGRGVAARLVEVALDVAAERGFALASVTARVELAAPLAFWRAQGFALVEAGDRSVPDGPLLQLDRRIQRGTGAEGPGGRYEIPDAAAMQDLGRALATHLRPGDLVILSGGLGAGKTTLTQGVAAGLEVRGQITSPTFVIARVHPSLVEGPALVHVDAYRLGGLAELDDLDLDTSLEDAVTVVEWGEGVAEALAEDRLEIQIDRALGAEAPDDPSDPDDPRVVTIRVVGERWAHH